MCLFVDKRKNDKTEAEFRFRFLCLFVHKRKNDKTEAEFRFSFFVFLLSKKQKTIKRKSNFVYLFLKKDSIKQKKKILSKFWFGGIRFMDSRKETRTLEFWQFLEILPLFLSAKILWRRHIIKFQ